MDQTQKRRIRDWLLVLTVIADVIAIASALAQFQHIAVGIAAGAAVLLGLFILAKEWGKTVGPRIVVAFLCVLVGVGVIAWQWSAFAVGKRGSDTSRAVPTQAPAPPTTSPNVTIPTEITSPSNNPTNEPSSTPSESAAEPEPRFAGTVEIFPSTGVDIDAKQTVGKNVAGLSGAVDFYMEYYGLLRSYSALRPDRDTDVGTEERCKQVLTRPEKSNPVLVLEGEQYCFKTSSGRLAWVRVAQSNYTKWDTDRQIFLEVRVW